jgi:hypothetical protein
MSNDRASGPKVLGTLVDRAVSMPYGKPQRLLEGRRYSWNSRNFTIVDDATQAADFLLEALTAPDVGDPWSKAELTVDAAGPWWAKSRDDFCDELSPDQRKFVTDRLVPTVERAATALLHSAQDERWTWLWSQPSFVVPGALFPAIPRPDLVVGLSPKRCYIIDLKTTEGDLDQVPWSRQHFDVWGDYLAAVGFDVAGRWVLAVSTAPEDTETFWIEVP